MRAARGFTLLEVLVAVAILGLGLTIVLSAQTGVFWSYSRATKLSQAPGLLRCKMEEIELDLLKEGFSLLDEQDDGDCCEDVDIEGYSCSWKIEKIELPELSLEATLGGGVDAGAGSITGDPTSGQSDEPTESSGLGASSALSGGGPLGALATLQASGSTTGGGDLSSLAGMMGESGGPASMASMVMGLVYPDLKPMLEASIRKVTVTVHWKEGLSDRELAVTQYVTSPQQGGFDPLADQGLDEAADQALDAIDQLTGGATPPRSEQAEQ